MFKLWLNRVNLNKIVLLTNTYVHTFGVLHKVVGFLDLGEARGNFDHDFRTTFKTREFSFHPCSDTDSDSSPVHTLVLFCRLLILGMRVRLTYLTQASARALEQLSLGQCYQI